MLHLPLAGRKALIVGALTVSLVALSGCTDTGTPSPTSSATSTNALASSIENLIKSGIAQADAGNTDAAVTTFNNVLTLDPGNKFAFFNLGVLAQNKGDTDVAVKYYDKALATDPSYTPAMFNKAIILETTDASGAITMYEKIVSIDPKAATAFLRLSFLYTAAGQDAKAKEARDKAVALDPSLAGVTPSPAP